MWSNKAGASASQGLLGSSWFRAALGPLLLVAATSAVFPIIVVANLEYDGALLSTCAAVAADPVAFYSAWFAAPSWAGARILLAFSAFQLALMRLVPGKTFRGPVTPAGNVPVYTASAPRRERTRVAIRSATPRDGGRELLRMCDTSVA